MNKKKPKISFLWEVHLGKIIPIYYTKTVPPSCYSKMALLICIYGFPPIPVQLT